MTKVILHRSLDVPIMMTNLYPFLLGQAALKHERIPAFPAVPEPENCILVAHCGYLGVVPQSFSTEWNLKPKVLAIVNDNATAIDARLPEGPITLSKLHPKLDVMSVAEGGLERCSVSGFRLQKWSSDSGEKWPRSGALSRFASLPVPTGHNQSDIQMIGNILDFSIRAQAESKVKLE